MLEDISQKIQDNIRQGMKDKFGLSEKESQQSIAIMFEKFKTGFTTDALKENVGEWKQIIQGKIAAKSNPLKEKLNQDTIDELMQKVGLSEETAKKVKDFSLEEYLKEMKNSFANLEDKMDISGIIDKIKPENLEKSAKDLKENFGKLFQK
ncbi:MAG: hypothetical protein R2753_15850 [Chitinophagales bacterium]